MTADYKKQDAPLPGAEVPLKYIGYQSYPCAGVTDDEIDLRELAGVIWHGRWIIVTVTAMFAMASVLYALYLPNIYQSKALLAPSEDAKGGGVSRMAGQLGGLASLAGLSMGGVAGGDKVTVAMAVLESRKFITGFVDRHKILPELMAVESWDRKSNKLVFDDELYNENEDVWVRVVERPNSPKPSAWEAYKAFKAMLEVSLDNETGFVTVSLQHQSPEIAKHWVEQLIKDVNSVMKEHDVTEAQRSIEFLQSQLSAVALADMRTVFYQLIEEQTKTIMLAEVRDEYVFSTIDPPVVSEERAKPKRALIVVLGFFVGGMVSIVMVLILYLIRGKGHGDNKSEGNSDNTSPVSEKDIEVKRD